MAAKKRRFQNDGFDLDITYITDRCLAMSTPGFGLTKGYRNDIAEVCRSKEYLTSKKYLNSKEYLTRATGTISLRCVARRCLVLRTEMALRRN